MTESYGREARSILYADMPCERPDVTVLVPALNEEETIGEVIDRLLALPITAQIIVVDDGSDDRTGEILRSYGDKILLLTNRTRGGKGAAIRQALPNAVGKSVIIQDADLEYDPAEIPKLVEPIVRGEARVVYGTRFAHGLTPGMALPNKVVNRLLRAAVLLVYGQRITDEATCYKAFDTEFLKSLNLECVRFEFCPEVTAKSCRLGERILEIPIRYTPRTKAAGKKIRWTDAPDAFWTLLKHRFKRFRK